MNVLQLTFHVLFLQTSCSLISTNINIEEYDDEFKVFDGIGAISGGGATSKLLMNYPLKQRNEILDYLFKPQYGASLQILKVEIGGDSQSTDGSESSHMHAEDDGNYQRGYEWWIMKEAKKRNPSIKLYGLPWVFPGWLSDDKKSPYHNISSTVRYVVNWIVGAKSHHGLNIDFIGVWNERECNADYVKLLRQTLNKEGFNNIKLVAPDAMNWSFIDELLKDEKYMEAVDIIGQHYPGGYSPSKARLMNKKLWASEDYSTMNDVVGAGCWARVLNEGVVFGYLTSFIAWNMVCSYYEGLPYSRSSLMTANQPWSGHYEVNGPIWITAHHTHFYDVGWMYSPHGAWVGVLEGNGTFITLTRPQSRDITIVMETIDPHDGPCMYHMHNNQSVAPSQLVTFQLKGQFASIDRLHVWMSRLNFVKEEESVYMKKVQDVEVKDGKFAITLLKNWVITLTTVARLQEMDYPRDVPGPQNFPVPYVEDFEGYNPPAEPFNLAQQSGSFEVSHSSDLSHRMVLTQKVTTPPVDTCQYKFIRPLVLVGDVKWKNVRTRVSAYIRMNDDESVGHQNDSPATSSHSHALKFKPRHKSAKSILSSHASTLSSHTSTLSSHASTLSSHASTLSSHASTLSSHPSSHSNKHQAADGVFIASQVESGGCDVVLSDGIHFYVDLLNKRAILSLNHNMTKTINSTFLSHDLYNRWFTIQLDVMNDEIMAMIDDDVIFHHHLLPHDSLKSGFVVFGPNNFGLISFDDFVIGRAQY